MSDPVKPPSGRRAYTSAVRDEQARRTRLAVLEAARDLFLSEGFAATTVPALAERAGVSVQTVYKLFGSKARLAKAVFDWSIAGDDEAVPIVERPRLAQVRAEQNTERKLRLYGEHLAHTAPRHVPLQLVIRDAAGADPDAATVWAELLEERLRGMTMFAKDLHAGGHLREGVTAAQARDTLWVYSSAELYQLLVIQREWKPNRYGRWVADALISALT
jgi:AcrR family transcriptional regulator